VFLASPSALAIFISPSGRTTHRDSDGNRSSSLDITP
jgi:hypothetical protein